MFNWHAFKKKVLYQNFNETAQIHTRARTAHTSEIVNGLRITKNERKEKEAGFQQSRTFVNISIQGTLVKKVVDLLDTRST